tara:strand:+ start:2671 stop:3051 length:381 start_codon:yes stop_codon:yes gene_type:complete
MRNLQETIEEGSELSEEMERLLEDKAIIVCFIAMSLLSKKACEAASAELLGQGEHDVSSIFRALKSIAKLSGAIEEATGRYVGATFDLSSVSDFSPSLTDDEVNKAKDSIDGLCDSLFNEDKDETK